MSNQNRRLFLSVMASWSLAGASASDGGTDLQKVVDGTPDGGVALLPNGRFVLSNPLVVKKPMTISGGGDTKIVNASPGSPLVHILSSDVRFEQVHLEGAGLFTDGRTRRSHGDAIVVGDGKREIRNVVLSGLVAENVGDEAIAIEGGDRRGNSVIGVEIENVTLRGAGAVSNYHSGVYAYGGEGIEIHGCDIAGFGQCILTTARVRKMVIRSNVLHDTTKQHGIYLSGDTEEVQVISNTIHDVAGSGVKCSAPFSRIEGNSIVRARVWGINLKANLNEVDVLDNLIMEPGDDGIDSGFEKPSRTQKKLRIVGNRIVGAGDNGINFSHDKDGCTYRDIKIERNVIEGAASSGVRLRWNDVEGALSDGISVLSNTIQRCGGAAVSMGRGPGVGRSNRLENVLVADNSIDECSAGGRAAVIVASASGVVVQGNEIRGAETFRSPVKISHSDGIVEKDNGILPADR